MEVLVIWRHNYAVNDCSRAGRDDRAKLDNSVLKGAHLRSGEVFGPFVYAGGIRSPMILYAYGFPM